jgi:hypothetical protein
MTFSTRSNPRLGQSGVALTSLGAVGGARGTAAGALRIFVEFLTAYDRKAVSQLEGDIAKIDKQSQGYAAKEETRQNRLIQLQSRVREAKLASGKLDTEQRSALKQIEVLEKSRTASNRALAVVKRRDFESVLKNNKVLSGAEISVLRTRVKNEKEIASIKKTQTAEAVKQTARERQQTTLQNQLGSLSQIKSSIGPKLAGLGIGALGGIFGGALLGVGFAAADAAISAIGEKLLDIVDPARHARDAVKELGTEVNKLASSENISQLDAAKRIVSGFGINPNQAGIGLGLTTALTNAAQQNDAADRVDKESKALEILLHQKELEHELRQKVRDVLLQEAAANNANVQAETRSTGAKGIVSTVGQTINGMDLETLTTERLNKLLGEFQAESDAAALSQYNLAQAAKQAALAEQEAAALASLANDDLANAAGALVDANNARTDKAISGIPTESARTKALQAALDAAQGAAGKSSGDAARKKNLANIAEERELILLRMRLRLMGSNIDLDKYAGKFLLEAIDAKIAALQKEGQQQDRLNRLLDLQYKMSQTLRRNEGESIRDFIERRGKENRDNLSEQRDIEREATIERLQELRDKTADEVALADLAKKKIEAMQKDQTDNKIRNLQRELAASRKADAAAAAAMRKRLQAEAAAYADKVKKVLKYASAEEVNRIKLAIGGIHTLDDLYKVSASIQGVQAARGFLKSFGGALVATGLMSQSELNQILGNLDDLLGKYSRQAANFSSNAAKEISQYSNFHGFAGGGVVLRNSMNPFGQNIRVGEGGSELGMAIYPNRVANALRQNGGGGISFGDINIMGSDNPYRDAYRIKRAVSDGIQEALG